MHFADPDEEEDPFSLMHMPRIDADRSRSNSPNSFDGRDHEMDSRSVEQAESEDESSDVPDALLLFGRSIEHQIVPIEEGLHPDFYKVRAARHFQIDPGTQQWEAFTIHHVVPKPTDLAQCIIPMLAVFQGERSISTSIALIDINLHPKQTDRCRNQDLDSLHEREAWFLPNSLTRPALLHFLGIAELCRNIAYPCVILYGQHPWHLQDGRPYPILDGISIQIDIPIPNPEIPLLHYRDYARAHVPITRMYQYWQQQLARSADQIGQLFPSEDESILRAVGESGDSNTDEQSLMATNRPRPRAVPPVMGLTILVYSINYVDQEFQFDPSLGLPHYREIIGDAIGIHRDSRAWDNFLIFRVIPPPTGVDIFTHDPYIFALPSEVIVDHSFILIDLKFRAEDPDVCLDRPEPERKVHRVTTRATRIGFLKNLRIYELCIISGNDRCEVTLGDVQWHAWEFPARYIHDGAFATVTVQIFFTRIPLAHQLQDARAGIGAETMIRRWTQISTSTNNENAFDDDHFDDFFAQIQTRYSLQPFRAPQTGLPPPGNGMLDSLDTVGRNDKGEWVVVDLTEDKSPRKLKSVSSLSAKDQTNEPREINLVELLRLPTPMRKGEDRKPQVAGFITEHELRCDRTCDSGSISEANPDSALSALRQFCLPDFTPLFEQLMSRHVQKQPMWDAIHETLPEELRGRLRAMRLDTPDKLHRVEIYSDGAYVRKESCDMPAAWAFVVLAGDEHEDFLIDYGFGLVPHSQYDHGWTGAITADSRTAEIEALIHVCEWIIASSLAIPHQVCFDAHSAGFIASGLWTVRPDDCQGILLRNLAMTANCFVDPDSPVVWKHTKSHSGIFGNELADAFAKVALTSMQTSGGYGQIEYLPYIVGPTPSISWLWLWASGIQQDADLPFALDGTFCPTPTCENSEPTGKIMNHKTVTTPSEPREKTSTLFVCTYNVGTMKSTTTSFGANLPMFLREQIASHGVDFFMLQETRARQQGLIESDTHVRLITAAWQGRGGTEIWITKKVRPNCGKKFDTRQIVVLHAEPEILFVKITYDGIPTLLLSAHAPHTGQDCEQIERFWTELTKLTQQFYAHGLLLIVGIDANTHFDCEQPPHLGGHGLELKASKSASHFLAYLRKFDLFLPSTYAEVHSGETVTWTNPANGSRARCDYVALPISMKGSSLSTWTALTIDVGKSHADHEPLFLSLKVTSVRQSYKAPRFAFNRRALNKADPAELAKIFDFPAVPWERGVDEHAVMLSETIHSQLVRYFPSEKSGPRRSYITDETWQIRTERIQILRKITKERAKLQLATLHDVFEAWQADLAMMREHTFAYCFVILGKVFSLHRVVEEKTKQLRKALRHDRTEFVQSIAEKAEAMPHSEFYDCMRQLGVAGRSKLRGFKPLPTLKDSDGSQLETQEQIAERWRRHFAEQEDGITATIADLVREQHTDSQPLPAIDCDLVPSLFELESQFRKTAALKAVFDDLIPGELPRRRPDLSARVFYPLLLKTIYMNKEPLLYKGALLVPAYKQKGSVDQCDSYRSLAVSSTVGKAFHALYRRRIASFIDAHALPLQIGGRAGKSVTQASQALIATHYTVKKRGWSAVFLFLDVQQAFYRLLRQHVTEIEDPRNYRTLFDSLGICEDAYYAFCELFEKGTGLDEFEVPEQYKMIFAEFFRATWFVVPNSRTITHTRRGSRPGDSLADLAFLIAMTHMLKGCHSEIEELQKFQFMWSGECRPPDGKHHETPVGVFSPIWADDFAIVLFHPTADTLMHLATDVVGRILDAFVCAGMKPNMQKGKTEIIVDVRGPGATGIKKNMRESDLLFVTGSRYEHQPIHIVATYRHLGTWIAAKAKLVFDIKTKIAIGHSTITKYKTAIFGNRKLAIERKIQMFRQLVLSAIIFNAAAWHVLSPIEWRTFFNGIFGLLKRIAILHFGKEALIWSHDRICFALRFETPERILSMARLRYLQHLVRNGQRQLWAILQQDRDWWEQLDQDLQWLRRYDDSITVAKDLFSGWDSLYLELAAPGMRWKNGLKRCLKATVRYEQVKYSWNQWNESLVLRLQSACSLPIPQKILATEEHFCLRCKMTFARAAAWSVHAFKVHGRINPARKFAVGTQCARCLKDFHTHISLVNHLKNNAACLECAIRHGESGQVEPGLNSRAEKKGRPILLLPYLRAEGPMPAEGVPTERGFDEEEQNLIDAWTQAWKECTTARIGTVLEALRIATLGTTLAAGTVQQLFAWWLSVGLHEDDVRLELFNIGHQYLQSFSAEWFLGMHVVTAPKMSGWRDLLTHWCSLAQQLTPPPTAGPKYSPVIVAHLFSGRRRSGDIQQFVEECDGFLTDALAISVDVIFDVVMGDLVNPKTLAVFIDAIREHRLHAIVVGPPCETWSRARSDEDGGPRVLRGIETPWSLPFLKMKELCQTDTGNNLLGSALTLFVEAILATTVVLLEHPAEPSEEEKPSIWRLPLIQVLLKFTNCQLITINQGLYGAKSVKPTSLMIANGLENAKAFFDQFTTQINLPTFQSIGKDRCGKWNTSSLKEYPMGLCRAMVLYIERSLARSPAVPSAPQPAHFLDSLRSLLQNFDYEVGMGPDYAG